MPPTSGQKKDESKGINLQVVGTCVTSQSPLFLLSNSATMALRRAVASLRLSRPSTIPRPLFRLAARTIELGTSAPPSRIVSALRHLHTQSSNRSSVSLESRIGQWRAFHTSPTARRQTRYTRFESDGETSSDSWHPSNWTRVQGMIFVTVVSGGIYVFYQSVILETSPLHTLHILTASQYGAGS